MFGIPVGYAWQADTYCPECMVAIAAEHDFDPNDYEQSVEHECAPMFETTETDTPDHCDFRFVGAYPREGKVSGQAGDYFQVAGSYPLLWRIIQVSGGHSDQAFPHVRIERD